MNNYPISITKQVAVLRFEYRTRNGYIPKAVVNRGHYCWNNESNLKANICSIVSVQFICEYWFLSWSLHIFSSPGETLTASYLWIFNTNTANQTTLRNYLLRLSPYGKDTDWGCSKQNAEENIWTREIGSNLMWSFITCTGIGKVVHVSKYHATKKHLLLN
jgi:hypothetical protein